MPATLNTEPNIAAPDDFYEALIDTHRDLAPEQSELVNAKLILLLANHIGDLDVLRQAMAHARAGMAPVGDGAAGVAAAGPAHAQGAPLGGQRKEES